MHIESLRAEDLIKNIYGSVKAFCVRNDLSYYKVKRAIDNPLSERYSGVMKTIGKILMTDSQTVKNINESRREVRIKIIVNDGSIAKFSEKYGVDYTKLWRYVTGRNYNLSNELRAAFLKAGYINEKAN